MLDTSARLLRLLSLLQQRPHWSGDELAQRLGVTTRSVRRDVDRLRQLGYEVDSVAGPGGGYELGPGAELPPLHLDDDEVVAVWVALAATTGGAVEGFEQAALSALGKIDRFVPPRLRPRLRALRTATVSLGARTVDPVGADLLVRVARACAERDRLRLGYVDRNGRSSERRFDPYRLVSTGRRWYLVGLDADRQEWRTLRLDRVTEVVPTGHRFVLTDPPDAAELVSTATTIAPYRYTITVLFKVPADEVRRRVPPSVGTVSDEGSDEGGDAGDGVRSRLVIGSDSLVGAAGHLVWLDLPFEVIDPPELRDYLAALGQSLATAHAHPER